jgi:alpha-1,3-fucosyltransferase
VNNTKIILFWNNFFDFEYWGMPRETNSKAFLDSINCPVTNCILTHDKNYLSAPELYDALVFHGWDFAFDIPEKRSPHQLYVLATLE